MKLIKKVLIFVVILIAIPLVAALFIAKDYSVVRTVVINRPVIQVFDFIKLLKNQDNFSKWNKMDPNMRKEYKGIDGTTGFISAWDSKVDNVGKGEQEIKQITEGSRLDFEIRFLKPFKSVSQAYMTTEATGSNQTKVSWGFKGRMPYPMNIMRVFCDMDKMIGDDLQTGLDNLKQLMETTQ